MNLIRPEQLIADIYHKFMDPHVNRAFGAPEELGGLLRRNDYGMFFQVNLDFENHGYEKDGCTLHEEWKRNYRVQVTVIITADHRVYVSTIRNPGLADRSPSPAMFRNTSNHSSAWYTDGLNVFNEQVSRAWDILYNHVPEEHKPATRYEMDPFSVFGIGMTWPTPFAFVRVKREPIIDKKASNNGYLDRLADYRQLHMAFTLTEDHQQEDRIRP